MYSYFDHEADIGIVGQGRTLEEAFSEGAQAMLDLVCDYPTEGQKEFAVQMTASDLESLWISFLNELLAQMDIQDVFLSSCRVREIKRTKDGCSLEGMARGVPRHNLGVVPKAEVKAATYCQVQVVEEPGRCKVQCVVDI